MEAIEQLHQEVKKTKESQQKCSQQTDVLLSECIRTVERCRSAIAQGGSSPAEEVGAAKKLIEGLKVNSKLTSSTKELHKLVGNMGKSIDKIFTTDIAKAWSGIPADIPLYDKIILEHLYHEGAFEVAGTLAEEAHIDQSEETKRRYLDMHAVLQQIKQHNLGAALEWVQVHREALEKQGEPSSFEFHIHKVGFTQVLQQHGRRAALEYGRRHFGRFEWTKLAEIQHLMGCLCFFRDGPVNGPVDDNPYYADLLGEQVWDALAEDFLAQSCALIGQAQSSPLLVTVAAGSVALPTLLKLASVMTFQQSLERDRDGHQQLPVDIPLGREFVFNSIFACPVAREQSTADNPPVILPCGHCMCKESMFRMAKTMTRSFKCPYCPAEATPLLCKEIRFPPVS